MGGEGGGRNAVAKLFVFILDVSINILADYGLWTCSLFRVFACGDCFNKNGGGGGAMDAGSDW